MTPSRLLQKLTAGIAAVLALPVLAVSAKSSDNWTSFRPDSYNNGIVHAVTPRSRERSAPLWESIYGLGYPGPLLLVEDSLVCLHGGYADFGTLTRIDPRDGTLLASRETQSSPSWNTAPPCCADGRIYCQLDGGMVQAFRFEDLEPLWTFRNPGGGKAHNPIVYDGGRLYVGFGFQSEGSFVCLDAETGRLIWKKSTPRGQFSAGALVAGDFVIYGDEAGHLTVRSCKNGDLIQDLTVTSSPIRSGVCQAEGKLFFTADNGHLYYGSFQEDTGTLSRLTDVNCSEYGPNTLSTPTVYDGYVYIALGSEGGSENHVVCVDTVSSEIAWAVPVGSNPRCSVILSDARRDQGSLFLYVTAGRGLTVVEVPTDGSQPQAQELFLPEINAQPSTCSVTIGSDGTLYYTNASSAVFAVSVDEAYLDSLTGSVGRFTREFEPGVTEYTYLVPQGTEELSFTAQSSGEISLNGDEISLPVPLTDGAAEIELTVTDRGRERTYVLDVQEESDDTGLAELSVRSEGGDEDLPLFPSFQSGITDYAAFTVDCAASCNAAVLQPVPKQAHSQVQVFTQSNVRTGAFDRETMEILPGEEGYTVPFEDQSKPITLRIQVTAENGDVRNYTLLLSKAQSAIDDIGEVSLERRDRVVHARRLCDGLPEAQQLPGYAVLLQAEQQLSRLEIADLNSRLENLPPVTADSGRMLAQLRADYDALTPEQQEEITEYGALQAAEAEFEALESQPEPTE